MLIKRTFSSEDNMDHPIIAERHELKETTTLNLGPTHPATHGVFQNVLEMDGERIVSGVSTLGYIHRAFEKIAEHRPFYQITPLTDRLNYCSSPINNMGWHMTVEKLLGIQTPKRVDYLRVIIMELARISDHLICNSILGVDTGAYTGFLYLMEQREHIYEIYEEVCGARLTTNIGRIGGFERDFNDIALAKIKKFLKNFSPVLKEFEELFNRNRIFIDRTAGVAAVDAETAMNYSWTGPILRACGVDYDVRVNEPYSSYEDFDFDIPVGKGEMGTKGDCWDRFKVRIDEIEQSVKIIEQCLEKLQKDLKRTSDFDPRAKLPKKIIPKAQDFYFRAESPRGELGYYFITDGNSVIPKRVKARAPSFHNLSVISEISRGILIADLIAIIGSIDIVLGEVDR